MINKAWLTSLKYTVAGSLGKQYNWDHEQHTTVGAQTRIPWNPGNTWQDFLPYEYYSDLKIEGKPVYAQAKLTANISGKYGIFLQ